MLKERLLIESFYAKEICLLLKPYLESLSLYSWVLSVLFRLSLVEYFCTQGSLTLVAGEPHEQICLDRAAWLLFVLTMRSKCVALGQGSFIVCFVLYYNATPLFCFVINIEPSCEVWNYCFVNYVIVRLPLFLLWCIYLNKCCNTAMTL